MKKSSILLSIFVSFELVFVSLCIGVKYDVDFRNLPYYGLIVIGTLLALLFLIGTLYGLICIKRWVEGPGENIRSMKVLTSLFYILSPISVLTFAWLIFDIINGSVREMLYAKLVFVVPAFLVPLIMMFVPLIIYFFEKFSGMVRTVAFIFAIIATLFYAILLWVLTVFILNGPMVGY
jgi:hypothetical protein